MTRVRSGGPQKRAEEMKETQIVLLAVLVSTATSGQVAASSGAAALNRPPGSVFRDCPACPEMVVIPAGSYTMGSSPAEQQWAATHGGTLKSVADESPQHAVTLQSFALSRYPVTRGDYAAFVRETGYSAGDGCGRTASKWNKEAALNWQNPGFDQRDRDPVVCVSWNDALAYIGLDTKSVRRLQSACALTGAARGNTRRGSFVLPRARGTQPISAL